MSRGKRAMRVFVAGCRGQLGRDWMAMLADGGHTARGMDLPEWDVSSWDAVQRAVEPFQPEAIVNAAAFTRVDDCEREEALAFRVNAEGPEHLARVARRCGCPLLHVSTDYVFDGRRPLPQPYTEADAPQPASAYGRSKLEGERRVAAEAGRYMIFRTAWLYGRHGNNFLKTMLKLARQQPARVLRVVDDQVGSPTWSFRLAEQMRVALEGGGQGLYHATAEGHASWYELARYFLEAMEVPFQMEPCTTAEFPRPAPRPANSILENARLKAEGWNRMRDWKEDVTEYVRRFRAALWAETQEQP